MITSLFISVLAKIGLALIAFLAIRLSLYVLDQALDVSFKEWIQVMAKDHPEKLSLYYGMRLVAVAVLFGFILG
ncbi:MAG: hypothetical protein QM489_00875 [Candidatus Izemoplasma sp.]